MVRLAQGDFARETAFSDDPVSVAVSFVEAGARWLHVVDLDGARHGEAKHGPVVQGIVDAVGDLARVEVAGGLRTEEAVASALEIGAVRVVVGTAALRDPAFAGTLVQRHGPDRVAVAADVRDGAAVGEGWRAGADRAPVESAIRAVIDRGIRTLEVTAIDRDGLLGGPDLDLYRGLIRVAPSAKVIASAGIAAIDDVRAVRDVGGAGAIIGRALYEGRLALPDALAALDQATIDPTTAAVRRPSDGELLGYVRASEDGWSAEAVFGGCLARTANRADALEVVEADGLASLARRWWYRPTPDADWEVALVQEAWPGRARLVRGRYALPGMPTIVVERADLARGAVLTLERPPGVDADRVV